ncbi:MAG TPA: protein translocase subunit SecF [Polyangiaceae bacterium]|nr:protein translocase subunit SecF [Polyangiaceae bacterium]
MPEFIKPGRYYDFMKMRAFWLAVSIGLTLGSFVLIFTKGPNYGTDFKGGTEVELAFKRPIGSGELRQAAHDAGFAHPDVVEVSDPSTPNKYIVRVQEVSALDDAKKAQLQAALCYQALGAPEPPAERCPPEARPTEIKFSPGGDKVSLRYEASPDLRRVEQQVRSVPGVEMRAGGKNPQEVSPRDHKVEIALKSKGDQLVDGLRQRLGPEVMPEQALRVEWVGPKAGKQLRDAAIRAVGIAIICIMAYIAFRFDLRFAPGGILALVHDSVVVIGAFIVLNREVTLSTIAAILTVVGYSIADTVIVYDRIRENLGKHRGKSFAAVINISVSETLSRTILTSGTVMLSMLPFLWGTGAIKDFSLAMVIGVLAGTYSSIYVAAPFTEWVDRRFFAGDGGGPGQRPVVPKAAPKRADAVV